MNALNDHSITYHAIAVVGMWLAGLTLVVAEIVWYRADGWGNLGIVLAIGAAVLQVWGFICVLDRRERTAFELGQASVRSLR